MTNASGEDTLDDLIAYGYLQVNTGKLDVAIDIFRILLRHRKELIGANLGLGSALAMKGMFDDAISAFTKVNLWIENNDLYDLITGQQGEFATIWDKDSIT